MAFRSDILVQKFDDRSIAVVEVKNRQNLSRDIAMILRRDMVEYGLPLDAPYFLLLSQDVGFLWKQPEQAKPDAPPTIEFPMNNVITRYLPELSPKERLRGSELELLVIQWLTNLAWVPQETVEEPEKSLASCGFLEAIQGATATPEARVHDRVY